jgi:hypothetical protein
LRLPGGLLLVLIFADRSLSGDSDGASARHEIEDKYDDGENQKDMNPTSQCVAADESYNPEDEENNRNCPKHVSFS